MEVNPKALTAYAVAIALSRAVELGEISRDEAGTVLGIVRDAAKGLAGGPDSPGETLDLLRSGSLSIFSNLLETRLAKKG